MQRSGAPTRPVAAPIRTLRRVLAGHPVIIQGPLSLLGGHVPEWLEATGSAPIGAPRDTFTFGLEVAPDPPSPPALAGLSPLAHYNFARGYRDQGQTIFVGVEGAWLLVDEARRHVQAWIPEHLLTGPPWPIRDLLNAGLAALLRACGRFPLHASGAARSGLGLLVVGRSGSGKTSLNLNLLRRGWDWVADDKIILTAATDGPLEAWGLLEPAHVDPALARYFPEVAGGLRQLRLDPNQIKLDMVPSEIYGHVAIPCCSPRWLVFPEIGPALRSSIQRMDTSQAFAALLEQSPVVSDPVATRQNLALLARLARECTSLGLQAGTDLLESPQRLRELLEPWGIPAGIPGEAR